MLDFVDCAESAGGAKEKALEEGPMPRFMGGGKENGFVVGSLKGASFGAAAWPVVVLATGGLGALNTGRGLLKTGFGWAGAWDC